MFYSDQTTCKCAPKSEKSAKMHVHKPHSHLVELSAQIICICIDQKYIQIVWFMFRYQNISKAKFINAFMKKDIFRFL